MKTKTCSKCICVKPLSEFASKNATRLRSWCKACEQVRKAGLFNVKTIRAEHLASAGATTKKNRKAQSVWDQIGFQPLNWVYRGR